MKCVLKCNDTEYIVESSNSQFQLKICRNGEYYIDPSSTEIIELGTKKFPYKALIWPIREIYHNFFPL